MRLGDLKTTPSFLKLQVNILRIHELSLLVFINSLCLSLHLSISLSDSINGRGAGRAQHCLGLHLHLGCHWISFLGRGWYV